MKQTFFITGSGTGIGKTLVACALVHQLRAAGKSVSALKPVISGYAENDPTSDTAQLLHSMGQAVNPVTVEAVSPWRFGAPLAPAVAARKEGRQVSLEELIAFCNTPRISDITLIEGAGGVMAPLTEHHTMLDWMAALKCPAILVAGTALGAISHALTAGECLRARGIAVQAVVVSESETSAMTVEETTTEIQRFMPYAKYMVPLPRVAGGEKLWQHVADIKWILT